MLSRSRFAGLLAVNIGGRAVAQHSVLQILVGAALGISLGLAAYGLYLSYAGGMSFRSSYVLGWWWPLVATALVPL